MSQMRILNSTGDTKLEWDVKDEMGVEKVREQFDELIEKGWMAFDLKVDPVEGTSGSMIREFNPEADTIIMSRPLVGG